MVFDESNPKGAIGDDAMVGGITKEKRREPKLKWLFSAIAEKALPLPSLHDHRLVHCVES